MKKIVLFFISILSLITLLAQQATSVEGIFMYNTQDKTVTLENFLNPKSFSLTANINNNAFKFQFNLDKENIFKLRFPDGNYYALIIKPGEHLKIKIHRPGGEKKFPDIEGSEQTQKIYNIEHQLLRYRFVLDSIKQVYAALAPEQNVERQQLSQKYYQIENEKNYMLANLLKQKPQDLANIFFIEQLSIEQYFPLYELIDSMLYKKYNYIPVVVSLHEKILANKKTAIGSKAPDIELPTPEGKLLNLYSIQAKIIIVDFWASWCGPCRRENPNLVKIYHDFKDKGLAIFGVSLDSDSLAWVKAIKDDKLDWYHVSDLKKWQSSAAKLYGVNSIPSSFILNENKIIIAKNLRGEQLRQFINQQLQ